MHSFAIIFRTSPHPLCINPQLAIRDLQSYYALESHDKRELDWAHYVIKSNRLYEVKRDDHLARVKDQAGRDMLNTYFDPNAGASKKAAPRRAAGRGPAGRPTVRAADLRV